MAVVPRVNDGNLHWAELILAGFAWRKGRDLLAAAYLLCVVQEVRCCRKLGFSLQKSNIDETERTIPDSWAVVAELCVPRSPAEFYAILRRF